MQINNKAGGRRRRGREKEKKSTVLLDVLLSLDTGVIYLNTCVVGLLPIIELGYTSAF